MRMKNLRIVREMMVCKTNNPMKLKWSILTLRSSSAWWPSLVTLTTCSWEHSPSLKLLDYTVALQTRLTSYKRQPLPYWPPFFSLKCLKSSKSWSKSRTISCRQSCNSSNSLLISAKGQAVRMHLSAFQHWPAFLKCLARQSSSTITSWSHHSLPFICQNPLRWLNVTWYRRSRRCLPAHLIKP